MVKNLFDYATKELSQDAFLRWVFESYEDEELGKVVRCLLGEFCRLQDNEIIEELTTKAQSHHIDITVRFKTNFREEVYLFIEDKVFSNEHNNQLSNYDEHIKSLPCNEKYKIFYKTDYVNVTEQATIAMINASNKKDTSKWMIFDINKIFALLKQFEGSKNLILSHYVEHIKSIHDALNNTIRPTVSSNSLDYLKWEGYFHNVIIPKLNGYNERTCEMGKWRSAYAALWITKGEKTTENIPYLEIRSRDCLGGKFKARILCYNVKNKDAQIKKVKANIKEIKGLMSCDYKNQLAVFQSDVHTDDDFINAVNKGIQYYLRAMKDWQ